MNYPKDLNLIEKVVEQLLKEYKLKELAKLSYNDVYNISKLYNVVYVGQVWDITDVVYERYKVRMSEVQSEIYNLE